MGSVGVKRDPFTHDLLTCDRIFLFLIYIYLAGKACKQSHERLPTNKTLHSYRVLVDYLTLWNHNIPAAGFLVACVYVHCVVAEINWFIVKALLPNLYCNFL